MAYIHVRIPASEEDLELLRAFNACLEAGVPAPEELTKAIREKFGALRELKWEEPFIIGKGYFETQIKGEGSQEWGSGEVILLSDLPEEAVAIAVRDYMP